MTDDDNKLEKPADTRTANVAKGMATHTPKKRTKSANINTPKVAKNAKQQTKSANISTTKIAVEKSLDFVDLKPVWGKLIDQKRPDAESNLLKVTVRTTKLDPIAELALAKVKQTFSFDESALRKLINQKGWATELDRVIKRINALRISENRRVILAAVYPHLLNKLLSGNEANKQAKDEEVRDEVGFVDAVLYELERENGPLDRFAQEVVKLVGAKHRINFTEDNVLRDLVAHQVRVGL